MTYFFIGVFVLVIAIAILSPFEADSHRKNLIKIIESEKDPLVRQMKYQQLSIWEEEFSSLERKKIAIQAIKS